MFAALLCGITVAAAPIPGDPTDGHTGVDDLVRTLADLNLRPDFELTREQKVKVQDARGEYAAALSSWRVEHLADFRRLADAATTRPALDLASDRTMLLATVPEAGPTVEQMRAALTPAQRRRLDTAMHRRPADEPTAVPDHRFGAEVLPLPPDGIPRRPGFYKVRWTGVVTTATSSKQARMTYVVFLPKTYRPDSGPYPTLVFMHGSGENGVDGNGLFAGDLGPAADLRHRAGSDFTESFPMVLICPQCPPRGERWDQLPTLRAALGVLDDAQRRLRIDPDRLYITGLSMGGKGTWLLAGLDPDRFAALCPISSSTLDLTVARSMRYDSVWAINGSDDIEDGAARERAMTDADRDVGGDAELTLLPGRGHDVWNDFYSDPAFYQWFLKHRRTTPAERHRRDVEAARAAATRPATAPTSQAATRPTTTGGD